MYWEKNSPLIAGVGNHKNSYIIQHKNTSRGIGNSGAVGCTLMRSATGVNELGLFNVADGAQVIVYGGPSDVVMLTIAR